MLRFATKRHQFVGGNFHGGQMETEPDAMQAARIGALLGEMEAQRARGQLPFAQAPLRLFGVGGGRFVRVLDAHEAPLSPRSARRALWSPVADERSVC